MKPRHSTVENPAEWNRIVSGLAGRHLLQSWQWGDFKARHGWTATRIVWCDEQDRPVAAAQILKRRVELPALRAGASLLYCPRGPALDWSDRVLRRTVLADLKTLAERERAVLLKIDPELPLAVEPSTPGLDDLAGLRSELSTELERLGWQRSGQQIQFRNTLVLDLRPSEEVLLRTMKQKTRYNVRLAGRRGVGVRTGGTEDLDLLFKMYAETAHRDGFPIRAPEYYMDLWNTFIGSDLAQAFIATVQEQAVAALILYRFADRAWYLHGMSRALHREKMPNHLLQWEAIRWAKRQGCVWYDFWGAPDKIVKTDPLWGVYRFKQGFGGRLVPGIGAWDFAPRPGLYWFYTRLFPPLLALMRARGHAQTAGQLE